MATPAQALGADKQGALPGGYHPQQAQGLLQLRKFLTENYRSDLPDQAMDKAKAAKELLKEISEGYWTVFPYFDLGVVFTVARPGVKHPDFPGHTIAGEVNLYAAKDAQVVQAGKRFMEDVWKNTSHKELQMHTRDMNVSRLAKVFGWDYIGQQGDQQLWKIKRPS